MRKGKRNQLTRQVGEHLVTAELGRMGLVATPFAGNVPDFDLVAVGSSGRAVPIQVKAINGGSWQFNSTTFLEIEFDDPVQRVIGLQTLSDPNLLCVFVMLGEESASDRFFIFPWNVIQLLCAERYGPVYRRPRNWKSTHFAVRPSQLEQYENNWDLVRQMTSTDK